MLPEDDLGMLYFDAIFIEFIIFLISYAVYMESEMEDGLMEWP